MHPWFRAGPDGPKALGRLVIFLIISIIAGGTAHAAVWTDKADYPPGEIVRITGDGMLAGETVSVEVFLPDGTRDHNNEVVADGEGNFYDEYQLRPPEAPVIGEYRIVATGLTSGHIFETTFLDGNLSTAIIEIQNAACTSSDTEFTLGESTCARVTVTVQGGGNTSFRIQWLSPSSEVTQFEKTVTGNTTVTQTFTPNASGIWTVQVCSGGGESTNCPGIGEPKASATFTVVSATRTTTTSVQCEPNPVSINNSSDCTASVTDTASGTKITPTGTVAWTNTGGAFTSGSCDLDATGIAGLATCTVGYTPPAGSAGPHSMTATYGGDSDHSGSAGSTILSATQHSTLLSVVCDPETIPVNASTSCTATVADDSAGPLTPTGTIAWSNTGGAFSSSNCELSGTGGAASCAVQYNPPQGTAGPHTVTATYAGDDDHLGSSGNTIVTVILRTTTTEIVCAPDTFPVNSATACTATVTDTATGTSLMPSGTIDWSGLAGIGAFSGTGSCTLDSSGSCSVDYTAAPGSAGSHIVTATYSGDSDHKWRP